MCLHFGTAKFASHGYRRTACRSLGCQNLFFPLVESYKWSSYAEFKDKKWMVHIIYDLRCWRWWCTMTTNKEYLQAKKEKQLAALHLSRWRRNKNNLWWINLVSKLKVLFLFFLVTNLSDV
ncbi:hypothetical protein A4A49_51129 [Nicotiana attenuata]|uniref:Uncharacterized protein n=1 Tax=Nicotiana attenuata TaxID=49451 RepID=A0A1J6KPN5_NICAT|nr:hypothetical protein A4A49_51129 [Nicotiana attenuata]